MKDQRKMQTHIDELERHIKEQDEHIATLKKSNKSLLSTCVKYSDEIIRLRRAVTVELGRKGVEILGGCEMKHKHYDMIVAWAGGKTIQNFNDRRMCWEDITGDPYWVDSFQYRIKPEPKPEGVEMTPLSPEKILRYLDNGYIMTRQEQEEAAAYIRQLQESNEALKTGMIELADTIFRLRQLQEVRGVK